MQQVTQRPTQNYVYVDPRFYPKQDGATTIGAAPNPADNFKSTNEAPKVDGSMSAALRLEIIQYVSERKTRTRKAILAHCATFGWSPGLTSYMLTRLTRRKEIYRHKCGVYGSQPKDSHKKKVSPTVEAVAFSDVQKNQQINAAIAEHTNTKVYALERMVLNNIIEKMDRVADAFSPAEIAFLKERLLLL